MALTFQPKQFNQYNAFKAVLPDELLSVARQTSHHAAALYVGVGGDLSLTGTDGTVALFKNVASGTLLPIHVTVVNAAGTTASNIIALFRV